MDSGVEVIRLSLRPQRDKAASREGNARGASDVCRHQQIQYASVNDSAAEPHRRQRLCVFHPEPSSCRSCAAGPAPDTVSYPVIVFIHGGGWKRKNPPGDRFEVELARQGFVVVAPTYRLSTLRWRTHLLYGALLSALVGGLVAGLYPSSSPRYGWAVALSFACPILVSLLHKFATLRKGDVKHPAHVQDCARAVAWTVRNIQSYGGDAQRLFLCGHSAGGHIASTLALCPAYLQEAGVRLLPDSGKPDQAAVAVQVASPLSGRLLGLVGLSGAYSGRMLALDHMQSKSPWDRLSALFRRSSYLYPAFGKDEALWERCFPLLHCRDAVLLAAMSLPPVLLVNASSDFGLEQHSAELAECLCAAGVPVARWTLQGHNHASYLLLGWAALFARQLGGFMNQAVKQAPQTAAQPPLCICLDESRPPLPAQEMAACSSPGAV